MNRATTRELATMGGVSFQAVGKMLTRHGLKKGRDGKYDRRRALEIMAAGAALDKRNAQAEIENIKRSGMPTESLVIKGRLASLRRIVLQGDLLEIERDQARGDLIPLADHKAKLLEMQNVCLRIMDIWTDTIAAKRADGKLIDEMRAARDQVLSEVTAILDG